MDNHCQLHRTHEKTGEVVTSRRRGSKSFEWQQTENSLKK